MSRQDYLDRRRQEPRYDIDRAVARAHLGLAAALAERRDTLGRSLADMAEQAGISPARLELIEEGDTTSLTEVMRICRVLGLKLNIDDRLQVRTLETESEDGERSVRIEVGYAPAGAATS